MPSTTVAFHRHLRQPHDDAAGEAALGDIHLDFAGERVDADEDEGVDGGEHKCSLSWSEARTQNGRGETPRGGADTRLVAPGGVLNRRDKFAFTRNLHASA